MRLGWCRGSCDCTSNLGLGGSLVRVGGSCGGWMGLRRAGSVERHLRRLGSVRHQFSFCFVVLMGVLRMILCEWPFWIWIAGTYELASMGFYTEDQAFGVPRDMLRPGLIVEVGI